LNKISVEQYEVIVIFH